MSMANEHPALSHIEKTLADSYRKEIDQEENVWRSLPFFAATLALQLAALFQLVDRLPPASSSTGWVSMGLLGASGLFTLIALAFLAACVYPRRFRYLAPDPELLDYARGLIQDETAAKGKDAGITFDAVVLLKEELAKQYAVGSQHNRQINKRRERLRSIAGLATIVSVVLTLFLVGASFIHHIGVQSQEHLGNVRPSVPVPVGARPARP